MENRERQMDEYERNTEIKRETEVRDALGPIEGTTAERNAAESALSEEERGGEDSGGIGAEPEARSS
jgi:hypothetical protein